MKKWLLLSICGLFGLSLSGCSLQDAIQNVLPSREEAIQDINPDSTRVYMDELQGTLQTFSGNKITLVSSAETYTFDVSQATLETSDGMVRGDSVSVIYEGQLSGTDTSTVRALKVVDDYHESDTLKEKTAHGQVQQLTENSITVRSKGGKTATYPVTGAEQYYQNGIKAGKWVYIHYKGELEALDPDNPSRLYGSHIKVFTISDIDPFNVPDPTPTPAPSQNNQDKKEKRLRAVIQSVQTNILQVSVENTATILNLDMSRLPCYFSGGPAPGSHVTITYTGDFDGGSTEGISILGITGDIPESLSEHGISFTVSGDITASTSNTLTLLTSDSTYVTCNIENASNSSTGGLLSGSSVKITFNPAESRKSNIISALKIEDMYI